MKIATVTIMRELDRLATEKYGITQEILMENAGIASYDVIRQEMGIIKGKKFTVICGAGNNGGDGFVVARKLHSSGASVDVFLLSDENSYKGAARQNLETIKKFPIIIKQITSIEEVKSSLEDADAIIDAIFGTGLSRPVEGLYLEVIRLINNSGKKVFALDIPSGINGDTGQEIGISVKADFTITFGLPKVGNLLYPGFRRGGKLYVSHISFPKPLTEAENLSIEAFPFPAIPERRPEASKMDFGPVLVIAGAVNYHWAPYASAYSFLKAGGGYVYLAGPAGISKIVAREGKEIVFRPQPETSSGSISLKAKPELLEASRRVKMVVMGPGLSLNEETQQLVRDLTAEIDKPLLLDGDGITAVARETEILNKRHAPTILTPHTGEMSRLTGIDKEAIEDNRIAVLRETAAKLNAIIVLKGPHSLTGYPDQRIIINLSGDTEGRAGMATAGTGDVLNGTIAAMFCLGMEMEMAVPTGVFIHGLAGDLAARKKGADGMVARDILNNLPYAVRYYREKYEEISRDYYSTMHIV